MQSQHVDKATFIRPGVIVSALSIALLSSFIVHNAVFDQKTRVYSDAGISIAANSSKLDKLFSVLNANQRNAPPGRTRVKVQPKISDTPEPQFAGDNKILNVQRDLARFSVYSGRLNGVLDPGTRKAIARYQQDNGMPVTGQPDPQLIERLQYVRRIHEATAVTGSVDRLAGGGVIELAQVELQRLGYDPGPIDGKLGLKTIQALRSFQTDMQISADGKITQDLLDLMASTSR